ncbi:MAG: response regulator transcription factor [Cellulosilyticaceae bacterium]
MSIKIGLVEDEKNLNDIVSGYLKKESYKVLAFDSAEMAMEVIDDTIHLWILDIMLPGKSGFELMDEIKKVNPKTPVILISARDQDFDRILGFEKGGEDYMTKPFSPKELVLRVKRILDRCYQEDKEINIANYRIELNTHRVYDGNELLELSNREYLLLTLMCKGKKCPFTRDEILNNVWERGYFGSDRVVDDLMRRLRKKMPRLQVETIYGYGYRLED